MLDDDAPDKERDEPIRIYEAKARNRALFNMRRSGVGYRECGEAFGISTSRARQICERECRREAAHPFNRAIRAVAAAQEEMADIGLEDLRLEAQARGLVPRRFEIGPRRRFYTFSAGAFHA